MENKNILLTWHDVIWHKKSKCEEVECWSAVCIVILHLEPSEFTHHKIEVETHCRYQKYITNVGLEKCNRSNKGKYIF